MSVFGDSSIAAPKCDRKSAGQKYSFGGAKIGNAHLKWAFGEAVCR